ncbi:MAG: phenylalanine--tRNA ligase subunit beta [Conexivisphaera sp.]
MVDVDLARLAALIGWGGPPEGLLDVIPYAGLDIESVEGRSVRLEYSPNRPDFATEWGIAAYLGGLLGLRVGPVPLGATDSGFVIDVDPGLRGIRPYVAGMVARGPPLDGEALRQLIRLQEDLHEGLGRRRRRVAIGLHDLSRVEPPIRYAAVGADHAFVPLGEARQWTVGEILESHELGRKYGQILAGARAYPALLDSAGHTLSFPPIINGEHTRVREGTSGLFVDVTGTSLTKVLDALSVLALTLSEMGFRLGYLTVRYGSVSIRTPDLSSREAFLSSRAASSLLGLELGPADLAGLLARARMGVSEVTPEGVLVAVPRYRFDVMHEVDLVEEAAYGYGYARLTPEPPAELGIGEASPSSRFEEALRDAATGLGMQEVVTTHLTSHWILYGATGRPPSHPIRVASSKSGEHEYLRDSLLPGLLWVLASNAHEPYPQRIFEVGVIVSAEGGRARERRSFAAAIAHARAGFTEMKSAVDALLRSLSGSRASYSPPARCPPPFIEGRCASVSLGGAELGTLGEVAPSALAALGIQVPVAAAELDVDALEGICAGRGQS